MAELVRDPRGRLLDGIEKKPETEQQPSTDVGGTLTRSGAGPSQAALRDSLKQLDTPALQAAVETAEYMPVKVAPGREIQLMGSALRIPTYPGSEVVAPKGGTIGDPVHEVPGGRLLPIHHESSTSYLGGLGISPPPGTQVESGQTVSRVNSGACMVKVRDGDGVDIDPRSFLAKAKPIG